MHPFVNNKTKLKTTTSRHRYGAAVAAADLTEPPHYGSGLGDNNNQRTHLFSFQVVAAGGRGRGCHGDDNNRGGWVMVVLAAVGEQPERRGETRVRASDVVGWVDRKKRNTLGVRRKNPPEKFSGGGVVAVAGIRRWGRATGISWGRRECL
ncbi:hypothetical protein Tco_1292803 [Tanacetum coccineum]